MRRQAETLRSDHPQASPHARPAQTERQAALPAAEDLTDKQAAVSEQEALAARSRMNQLYRSLVMDQARQQVDITMYAAKWCGACRRAREWLGERRIAYREIDIDEEPAAQAALRARNPRGSIPTIDIDGQILVGFAPGRIRRAIESAARKRTTAM